MTLLTYTKFQLTRSLLRPRLLLALPVFFFIAYRSTNGVSVLADSYGTQANLWDVLFYALGNGDTVYAVLTLLLLYLLGDLSEETRYGQSLMLRLASRKAWWGGKLLALFAGCLLYTALMFIVLVGVAAARMPLQNDWSPMILSNHTTEIGLPFDASDTAPWLLLVEHLSLLLLGWMGLGLLGMVAGLAIRRRYMGTLASIGATLIGYLGMAYVTTAPAFPKLLLISYHLEYTPGPIPMRLLPYPTSLVYWLGWLLLFGLGGFWIAQKQDDPGMRR